MADTCFRCHYSLLKPPIMLDKIDFLFYVIIGSYLGGDNLVVSYNVSFIGMGTFYLQCSCTFTIKLKIYLCVHINGFTRLLLFIQNS